MQCKAKLQPALNALIVFSLIFPFKLFIDKSSEINKFLKPKYFLISLIIFFELIIVIGGWKYKPDLLDSLSINISTEVTNTRSIGNVLYTDYIHLFQISGMILLVAMIGAIVLTYRERAGVKRQSYVKQISRERDEGVYLVEAERNKGVKIDA